MNVHATMVISSLNHMTHAVILITKMSQRETVGRLIYMKLLRRRRLQLLTHRVILGTLLFTIIRRAPTMTLFRWGGRMTVHTTMGRSSLNLGTNAVIYTTETRTV